MNGGDGKYRYEKAIVFSGYDGTGSVGLVVSLGVV